MTEYEHEQDRRLARLVEDNTKYANSVNAQIPPAMPGVMLSGYSYVTVDPRDGKVTYTEL